MMTTNDKLAKYMDARTKTLAAGKTLATLVSNAVEAKTRVPVSEHPGILTALQIHKDAVAAEDAAYAELGV